MKTYFQARKRAVTIHVAGESGESVEGAVVNVEQIAKDFPIGSAISKTILGNIPYQVSHFHNNLCKCDVTLLFGLSRRNGS